MIWVAGRSPTLVSQNLKATTLTYLAIAARFLPKTVPEVTARRSSDLGERLSHYFRRWAKIPFPPYDLRHCWAVRTLEFGLDVSLAAAQMGHSVQVHTELYSGRDASGIWS